MTEVEARLPAPAPASPPEVQLVKQIEEPVAQDKNLHAQDRGSSTAPNGAAAGGSAQDTSGTQVQPAREKDAGQQLRQALFQQQQLYRGLSFTQSNHSPLPPISSTAAAPNAVGLPKTSLAPQNIASPSGSPLRCGSCGTADTPLWRRETTGKVVCNACGLASVRKQAPSDRGVQSALHVAQPGPSGEAHYDYNAVQSRPLSPYIRQAPQGNGQKAPLSTQSLPKAQVIPLLHQSTGQADTASQPSTIPVVTRNANEPPVGSCPGDGHCNGQGGQDCCRGCPAFNNRYRRDLKQASGSILAHQNGSTGESKPATSASSQMQKLQAGDVRSGLQGSSNLPNHAAASNTAPTLSQNRPISDPSVTANMSMSARSDIGAMACENCGTRTTPLWRRDGEGRVACNACGLYYKLHGAHRPVNLNKPTIKRRKRAPVANGNGLDDQAPNGNAVVTSMPADQAESSGQPARKKMRRSKDGTGTMASEASSPRSQSRTASPPAGQRNGSASATLPGNGVGDLTHDELAAVTALAMHANHEKSLLHSTTMNSELLETHGHPLHFASHAAGAASLDSLRDGPATHKPTMQRALTGHEQLLAFRAELSRECAEAKSTIGRLEGFLSKSERIMSGIDARLKALQASSQAQVATQLPTPAASAETTSNSSNSTLAQLLQNLKPSGAITSTILKNRKSTRHDGSLPKATSILWEICPSTTQSLKVVAA